MSRADGKIETMPAGAGLALLGVDRSNLPVLSGFSRVLSMSVAEASVYGDGTNNKVLQIIPLAANEVPPDSVITLTALWEFPTPANAGRNIKIAIGPDLATAIASGIVGRATPQSDVTSLATEYQMWVAPDRRSVRSLGNQNFNAVASPTAGQGSAYSATNAGSTSVAVDFTIAQNIYILALPATNDKAILRAHRLEISACGLSPKNFAPSTAVAAWGNSLVDGSGSGTPNGAFFSRNGTTDGTTAVVTGITLVGSSGTIVPNMYVTGTGVPAGTIVLSVSGSTITLNKNTTAPGTVSLTFRSGAWPVQLQNINSGRSASRNGYPGQKADYIAARVLENPVAGRLQNPVFDIPRNNVGEAQAVANVLAAMRTIIANLDPSVFPIFVNCTAARNEPAGTGNNDQVLAINAAMLAEVGASHIYDAYSKFCTTSGRIADEWLTTSGGSIAAGEIHYNDWGYFNYATDILAMRVANGI